MRNGQAMVPTPGRCRLVRALSATDRKEREKVLFSSASGGGDYGSFPQYHAPIETMREEMLQRALPTTELKRLNSGSEADVDQWLTAHGTSESATVFQGLTARSFDMAVILDSGTGRVIGVAPFKPWR